MPIPIPDLSDGLTAPARRLLAAIDTGLREWKRRDQKAIFVKTWRPIRDANSADPRTSVMDYEAILLRLAQDWVCRYPLIDTQGNFGSIDGDPPAGMRYTEVRLLERGHSLLPAAARGRTGSRSPFPHLLCNGAWAHSGTYLPNDGDQVWERELPAHLFDCVPDEPIRGGEELSFLPPHHRSEIGEGLVFLLDHPDASPGDLIRRIPGPDFPTGAILANPDVLPALYESGQGTIQLRARMAVEPTRGGGSAIVIREIPYGLTRDDLIGQIAVKGRDGSMPGIQDVLDLSSQESMQIEIVLRKDAKPSELLYRLVWETSLQRSLQVNMTAQEDGKSRRVGLPELLRRWLEDRKKVSGRRSGSRSEDLLRKEIREWADPKDRRRTTIGT